jgi:hypothetical protein
MSRNYYVSPPTAPKDVPTFVFYRYQTADHVRDLIQWSIKEYDKALRTLTQRASGRTISFFQREYSPMRVLAECEAFRSILPYIDEHNYNQLSGRERVFVRRAYELFIKLSQ